MSAAPSKQRTTRPIHEFFKPYVKSTVPAKRPSPSLEETTGVEHSHKGDPQTTTPKAGGRTLNRNAPKTPPSSYLSPKSALGSRTSLSIRSRASHSKGPIEPPSTYKRAPQFGADIRDDTPKGKAGGFSFSFSDLPSSTHAVVKDGKVIEVLDSDEDDDKDSLESLEDLFGRRQGGHNTSQSSSPEEDAKAEVERVRLVNMFTLGKSVPLVGKHKLQALDAKVKAHKFDISTLMVSHFDDEEVESKVKEAWTDVDAATKAAGADSATALDKTLLAAVATTEEDGQSKVARLMDAVDRTEALSSDPVFLFFGVNGLNDWHDENPSRHPFPEAEIPEHLWQDDDDESRSRAYVSGYVADLAARGLISDKALNWTFENVVLEQQDDVRQEYIRCLQSASSSWTRTNIQAQDVQTVFQRLGADSTSLQDSVEIKPRHRLLKKPERRDPKYLLAVLDLFQHICADMDFLALSKLTSIICRLAIDGELTSNGRISSRIDAILERLLSLPELEMRSHVADRILVDIGQRLKDATLQAQLLSHILPSSPTALRIRILLAQAFLFGGDAITDNASDTPRISLHALAEHVSKSPDFDTQRRKGGSTMDYTALHARTHILDIAISDGGRPASFSTRADEQSFNKSVDRLADAVKATFVAIVDTGASHMTRTECKDVLQALYWRLLYSVRTELRPKRHIFDGKAGKLRDAEELKGEERGKNFMSRFLEKTKEKLREREGEREKGAEPPAEAPKVDGDTLQEHGGEVASPSKADKSLRPTSPLTSSEPSETEKSIRKQLGLED
ncbi:uncharacterized protein Z520_06300 [Fonsecaea multimorphosa CBS 102226]|uniref:Uncharacterized protein n=1 Tax=Fonsecaea multimorphosa CBS 102226 TaxID=1442371 RepID=A0A0D2H8N3_9EURO|nr:uncharacterized protein Z520_06300 [Fonsecaea multimorphosa CBS 102226]KIX98220.1 hypothetical protein Z520_06300 [Fonsecaea multimorphosa CBS 102226]OAL22645.1 hypothetical protein AYO22_07203 [Fonsecaea multimorphosa]